MHWGLTIFEKRRMLAIALDHPCFDGRKPLLSQREIDAILAGGRQKTGRQVVEEAMAQLGLTYDAPTQERRSFREALGDVSFAPGFRRTVVLAALALLLVLFVTLTPAGRAMAESMYSVLVYHQDGLLHFQSGKGEPAAEKADHSLPAEQAQSLAELAAVSGLPILTSEDELISFRYEKEADLLASRQHYRAAGGKEYKLEQEFFGADAHREMGTAVETYTMIPSKIRYDGQITLYAGTSEDGTNYLMGVADTFNLTISSRELSLSELEALMPRIGVAGQGSPIAGAINQEGTGPRSSEAQSEYVALTTGDAATEPAPVPESADVPEEAAVGEMGPDRKEACPSPETGDVDLASILKLSVGPVTLPVEECFPILFSEDEMLSFKYYRDDARTLTVNARYRTAKGQEYGMVQTFRDPDAPWQWTLDARDYAPMASEIRYDGEITLYGGISSDDAVFIAGYTDNFSLLVSSGDMTFPELKNCMLRIAARTVDDENLKAIEVKMLPPLDFDLLNCQTKGGNSGRNGGVWHK